MILFYMRKYIVKKFLILSGSPLRWPLRPNPDASRISLICFRYLKKQDKTNKNI